MDEQIISAAVIIGLSVNLRNYFENFVYVCNLTNEYYQNADLDCNDYGWTPTSRYGIFVGVWGMVAAFVGLAATFAESSVAFFAALAFDGLAWIFYLAGAVVSFSSEFCSNMWTSRACADHLSSFCSRP
jgi:hypothetical protein